MKKFLLGTVALLAMGASASAADLAARPYTKAPPMPVVTLEDFRRLDIAPSTIESDSGGFGLIRANTNFYATEEPQTLTTTMLGQAVAIQAVPVRWTCTGTIRTSSNS